MRRLSRRARYLILRLAGPYMSWGLPSRNDNRPTHDFPTKSALCGILSSAMDMYDEITMEALRAMQVVFFKVKGGELHEDYQTVGVFKPVPYGKKDEKVPAREGMVPVCQNRCDKKNEEIPDGEDAELGGRKSGRIKKTPQRTAVTYRQYLTGANFLVMIEASPDFVDRCIEALTHPKNGLWLGRECCIPSCSILEEVFDDEDDAVAYLESHGVKNGETEFEADVKNVDKATGSLLDSPVRFCAFDGYRRRPVQRGIWRG